MADRSRRRFLTASAGAAAAGLAGCSGLIGGSGGGGSGFQADAEFAPASVADAGGSVELVSMDVPAVQSEFPDGAESEFGFGTLAELFGIEVDDLDRVLGVESEAAEGGTVLTGSFGVDDVIEEDEAETAEYEGYEVVEDPFSDGEVAVADGVFVMSAAYEAMIDAKEGSIDRLIDRSEQWSRAVDDAAGGAVCGVETTPEAAWSMFAVSMSGDGDGRVSYTGYAYFESASEAAANQDAVRDSALDDSNEEQDVTIESVSVDGSVVVVEATVEDFQF